MGELLWSVILPCHPQSPGARVGWEGARISRSSWRPRSVGSHMTGENTQDPAPAVSPASPRVRPLCTRKHPGSSAAPRTGHAPTRAAAVWRGEGGPPSAVTPVPGRGEELTSRIPLWPKSVWPSPRAFFFLFASELTSGHCHQSPKCPLFACVQRSGRLTSRWTEKSRVCWPVRGWSHRPGPRCSLSHGDLPRGC